MEQLIAFAQYVSDDGGAMVKFLYVDNALEHSSSVNAETITQCISNNLDKCEIDVQKMMSLVSDGTKVMTGERTGVAARLKQMNSKLIKLIRLALACACASDKIHHTSRRSPFATLEVFH